MKDGRARLGVHRRWVLWRISSAFAKGRSGPHYVNWKFGYQTLAAMRPPDSGCGSDYPSRIRT